MKHSDIIKNQLTSIIEEFAEHKDDYVYHPGVDFTRDRKLPLNKVIELLLSMKGNTLNKELYEYFGRTPDDIVSSSAFVQQRGKIKPELFSDLFARSNEVMDKYDTKTYKGYKLYAVDGSDINIAYDETADTYWVPNNQGYKGCNQYHINAIYDVLNKVYKDVLLTPRPYYDERKDFIKMLLQMNLTERTLFIADRGYPSWNIFTHFKYKENADYLIRVKNNEMNITKDLPMTELDIDKNIIASTNQYDRNKDGYVIVYTRKGKQQNRQYKEKLVNKPKQWDFADKEELSFRIVRFPISDTTYETIFTSLPRDEFPISEIKKLYAMRWGIETSFRELKYVIGLTNLHSKKDNFVRQEIYAKLTMYNFCERIIAAAVVEQDDGRKYKYQVNFTQAMHICLDFFRCHDDYYFDVYGLIAKYILPIRPGRKDKRKLKAKTFIYFLYRVAA